MKRININNDWKFALFQGNSFVMQGESAANNGDTVDLPHDYCISLPRDPHALGGGCNGFYQGGIGVYKKYMTFPAGKHFILNVEGSYCETSVFFNEQSLMRHHHGYTPFLVDLTDFARPEATNGFSIAVAAIQPSTRWYSGGGLYRDVYLWVGNDVRIEPFDFFVTTESADEKRAVLSTKTVISSDEEGNATLRISLTDETGVTAAVSETECALTAGKNEVSLPVTVKNPLLWDDENPHLYGVNVEILKNGELVDTYEDTVGIRTLTFSVEKGMCVNGKSVKMRGGCMHHTHAALGAADIYAAVERQIKALKAAGFNAIRSAHNPPSENLLSLCDKYGLYLMDEAFDMWTEAKTFLDYHTFFETDYQNAVREMVKHDRNHVCVTSYSIGNEIHEMGGHSDGYRWAHVLREEIRKYDTTRPVTSGMCGIYKSPDANAPDDYKDFFMEGYSDVGFGDRPGVPGKDSWQKRTEKFMEELDIVGYNYKIGRYEYDHSLYPQRIMWGSENWALTLYDSWMLVEKLPYVLSDFCWTCYDTLGENGTGAGMWARDGVIKGINVLGYDWISCYQGDFDLAGFRRPQSYFREAVWKGAKNAEAKIFVTHPKHTGEGYTGTGWHWYDVHECWTYPDAYLNQPTKAEIYTRADRVVWYLNGKCVGESIPEKAIAAITIPYQRGSLQAVLYVEKEEVNRAEVHTVGKECDFTALPEKEAVRADNRDVLYIPLVVTDAQGNHVTDSEALFRAEADGGDIVGLFSGNPKEQEPLVSPQAPAFEGCAVLVLRAKEKGDITVRIFAFDKEKTLRLKAE